MGWYHLDLSPALLSSLLSFSHLSHPSLSWPTSLHFKNCSSPLHFILRMVPIRVLPPRADQRWGGHMSQGGKTFSGTKKKKGRWGEKPPLFWFMQILNYPQSHCMESACWKEKLTMSWTRREKERLNLTEPLDPATTRATSISDFLVKFWLIFYFG